MPRTKVTFDDVHEIGAKLPDVAASAGKLGVALKIRGQILACKAIHKSAEPDSLMVRFGVQRRDALLTEDVEAFYLTDHYKPYPVVLVRLPHISYVYLSSLLKEAWEFTRDEGSPGSAIAD